MAFNTHENNYSKVWMYFLCACLIHIKFDLFDGKKNVHHVFKKLTDNHSIVKIHRLRLVSISKFFIQILNKKAYYFVFTF